MNRAERQCTTCGERLRGRSDQRFCNDYCRNVFHNRHNNIRNSGIRNINNTLQRNRRILDNCLPTGAATFTLPEEQLAELGYNFKYHTHFFTSKKGYTYTCCYELGYRIDKRLAIIIRLS